ncbi:MAG: site-specific integrase, partial [Candidatus Bathyarchaeota archaeon]
KAIIVTIYDGFVKFLGIYWEPPKYKPIKKIPFIPTEAEIDQFIGACGKKLATFMQLLKETGMRCGEASLLKWTDLDYERRLVRITPEKNSNPRILKISTKLLGMLNNLPKTTDRIFSGSLRSMKSNIQLSRKGIARKLNNPRLLKISFHTMRHWKGTTEYHKTRDIIHIQKVLGHRDIKSTMIYITLENSIFDTVNDEFHVKATKSVDEACKLVESGFEFVTDIDEVHIFRKRK